ncbi:MAG: hypothetical protein JNG89_15445 [Planctomycetaceae bacterium]|nr:hypothetical protein [Planctomycetaceae bacterium]
MPPADQIFMGTASAVMCVVGLRYSVWLIEQTRKGQRLAELLGAARALMAVRAFLVCGAVLGVLLAFGVVNPLRW